MPNLTINGFSATTAAVDADELLIWVAGSSATKKITKADLLAGVGGTSKWTVTAIPSYSDSSTLTISSTGTLLPGIPLRYSTGGTAYRYGIVASVTTAAATIEGAALTSDDSVFEYADTNRVITETFIVSGQYADATDTALLENDLGMKNGFTWSKGKAYCVGMHATCVSQDTGANEPRVTFTIGGSAVSTANTNTGIEPNTTIVNNGVSISTANYDINYGENLEISVTANGSNDDGVGLKLDGIFILE